MSRERPPVVLIATGEEQGLRLDRFLQKHYPGVSRGSIRRLLERKQVRLEQAVGKKGDRLRQGQRVQLPTAGLSERPVPQAELPLEVIEVSPAAVVLNKAAGPATHPLFPNERDTIANALCARHPECADASPLPREGGFVHRLDWSTSGVLIAARSRPAYHKLRQLFSAGDVTKEYLALVHGRLAEPKTLDRPLETMPGNRRRMRVVNPFHMGQEASTLVEPLAQFEACSWVRVRCSTGRRHQVRVHLASCGHPLVGDDLYADGVDATGVPTVQGALLHASRVEVAGHDYRAELPLERRALLRRLGWSWD